MTIGLIGTQFMGRAHSNAYRQAGHFFDLEQPIRMKTLCGKNAETTAIAAKNLGWEEASDDWRKVVEDPEIDLIDVSVPGNLHAEISIAAAKAGKHVLCEKPLANSLEEARTMVEAATSAGVFHGVFFNYRYVPAVILARQLIEDGRIGEIYHFRGSYLQDWILDPKFPLVWRLQKDISGSGVHGDLNAHLIDLARFLVGEFTEVVGTFGKFISSRPKVGEDGYGPVTVDDAAAFLARFESGALGTFEATRFAAGRKNANRFEINGSKGSLWFDLERLNELHFFDQTESKCTQGFRTILCSGNYWPEGHIVGYEHTFIHLIAHAMSEISRGQCPRPSFVDGLKCQAVLQAVEDSVASRTWEKVQV